MKKKIIAFLGLIALSFSLTACSAQPEGTYSVSNMGIKIQMKITGNKVTMTASAAGKSEKGSGTIDRKKKQIKMSGETVDYTLSKDGKTISVGQTGAKIKLTKK